MVKNSHDKKKTQTGSSVIIDFFSRMISDTLFRNIRIHNEREQDVMRLALRKTFSQIL